jgi:hypothetical protein
VNKPRAAERTASDPEPTLPPEPPAAGPGERRAMIEEAPYCRAERRAFEPAYELDDGLQAERDIERALPGTVTRRRVAAGIEEVLMIRVPSQ